jgi:hypothetical protein
MNKIIRVKLTLIFIHGIPKAMFYNIFGKKRRFFGKILSFRELNI